MKATPDSPRMFQNNFLDYFSRSPWWTVPLVWVPIASYLVYLGPIDSRLCLVPVGFGMWTLTEYLLHRFVFHHEFTSKAGQYVHFLIHGVHHEWPNDRYRLVMPLAASAIIAVPFSTFYYARWGLCCSFRFLRVFYWAM